MTKTSGVSMISSEESCEIEQDLISELPECLVSNIVSRLTTKDAIRTSALSKHWEHMWTLIPGYVISDGNHGLSNPSKKPNFASFVERTLLLSNNLQSFGLVCEGEYDLLPWITAALKRNLHNLWIEGRTTSFVLSRELLSCYSLRDLYLDNISCTLKVHEKVFFPNLTKLTLTICILNELSNSDRVEFNLPLLERLDLRHCKWLNTKLVEIYAPKVTELELERPVDALDDCSLKITGDNIVNLYWHEEYALNHIVLSHVLSGLAHVVHACLDYYFGRDEDMVEILGRDDHFLERCGLELRKLLKGFSSLEDLELGQDGTTAIAKSKLGLSLPLYYKMERLVLHGLIHSEALLELLHATPYLKHLGISVWHLEEYDYEAEESVPSCIVSHLEKAMIFPFIQKTSQINLIKFFLKQASQLKSLSVMLPSGKSKKELCAAAEELSTYPIASTCLELTVEEWDSQWSEFSF